MPTTELTADNFVDGSILVSDLLVLGGLAPSKGEAKRLIQQGGILVNDEKVVAFNAAVSADAIGDGLIVKKGKKVFHRFTVKS
jgi:tyrosyl-tRNA synthetase